MSVISTRCIRGSREDGYVGMLAICGAYMPSSSFKSCSPTQPQPCIRPFCALPLVYLPLLAGYACITRIFSLHLPAFGPLTEGSAVQDAQSRASSDQRTAVSPRTGQHRPPSSTPPLPVCACPSGPPRSRLPGAARSRQRAPWIVPPCPGTRLWEQFPVSVAWLDRRAGGVVWAPLHFYLDQQLISMI